MRYGIVACVVMVVGVVGVVGVPARAAEPERDVVERSLVERALAVAGWTRADLGWRARGTWDRYPQDVPYQLRHVDDVFADPWSAVPWVRAAQAASGAQALSGVRAQVASGA